MMSSGTKEIRLAEGIQMGNLAPEINLQDVRLEGKKFVLLQFWAAYDGQSRALNTQMHNVLSQLKTSDVQLISVSLDGNKAVFDGVVKADRLSPETQFIDIRGKNSNFYKKYRLKSGFSNWLINSEGIIVAQNVNPKVIDDYLILNKFK
jgi:hypothetical protein